MIRGLYTSASAMQTNLKRMDVTSNNLANVDTDGYKKDGTVQRTFSEMLISRYDKNGKEELGALGTGVEVDESYTNFKEGNIQHTNNKLDLAVKGSGFFALETPEGIRYSRNGNFYLNDENQVVDSQGNFLLNQNNEPIQIVPGREISIDQQGQIFLGELEGETINLVDFENYDQLTKIGNNLYQTEEGIEEIEPEGSSIMQGYLEGSNVNVVEEMASMIEVTRAYESNQKVIQTIDNTLDKAVNDVGRLA
ncbi:MAG: flagellar basal-body rod protein FlgF [Halanaerobiales bacterium]|nr:flagellar basal-body rod protein FlgF [Halanaerobiales bacterium]